MQSAPAPDDAAAAANPKAAAPRQPLEIEPPDKRTPKAVLVVAGIAALNSANLGLRHWSHGRRGAAGPGRLVVE